MLVVLFSVDMKQHLFVDGIYEWWCMTVYEGGYRMSDDVNCINFAGIRQREARVIYQP